jgi:type I restriction enzyme M protein
VLDPACGTAGFLISSFKHILVANTDPNGDSTLSAEERELLARNFTGYDISPDMVRLSLVNLYLHGFRAPRIFEYDTLTSEERWNDHADVILANPPFMSPKGGIQPHKRFSVQSNRSEVLFVDYMAEHLTPSGRAGIIVPEGVIFQSGNAYKQLRRMLVENYLVAVISLPAGVFNPYSGVKTSILILDRTLAKRASTIGFFKVENDGFGLGAQRKEIVGDDLPATLSEVQHYLAALQTQAPLSEAQPAHGLIVARTRLADRDDYSLAIERYRDNDIRHSTYPWTELGTITLGSPQYGSGARKVPYDGEIRYVRITDLTDAGDLKQADPVSPSVIEPDCFLAPGDLLIARSGSVGRAYLHGNVPGTYQFAGYLIRFRIDPERALPAFVFSVMQSDAWKDWILSNSKTGTLTNINAKQYSSFRFPLPPLDVQREIVAEIEGYQRVIDGARAVVDNYRPRIAIDPAWPMVKVGSVSIVNPKKSEVADQSPTLEVSFVPMADVDQNSMTVESKQSVTLSEVTSSYTYFRDGDVLLAKVAPCFENGKGGIAYGLKSGIGFGSSELFVLRPSSSILAEWLYLCVASQAFRTWATPRMTGTGGLQRVPRSVLEDYEIPLPVLATQRTIVTEVAAEQAIVDANRELIARMEKRIADVLARVWGEA